VDFIAFGTMAASGGQYAAAGRRGAVGALVASMLGAWLNRSLGFG